MKLVVIYNPKSGTAVDKTELEEMFQAGGHSVEVFIDITRNFESTIAPWIDQGATIAAVGGDGTLSSTAHLLLDTEAVFAPLPGGTLNHFTKDLGITQNLPEAIKALNTSSVQPIDIATVNGKSFINNSSIGLYPSSLHERESLSKQNVSKWIGAIIASCKAFIRYQTYTITINNETFKTPFLFVGNNDYHLEAVGGDGRTRLDEGQLSVYAVASSSRMSLLQILGRAIIGKLDTAEDVKTWKTTKLVIHAKRSRLRVARDGELEHLDTPLTYEIHSGSLKIIGSS